MRRSGDLRPVAGVTTAAGAGACVRGAPTAARSSAEARIVAASATGASIVAEACATAWTAGVPPTGTGGG
ncbi:MAG: hypothetical protein D6738_04705 [Acidobacteria bacterium]|nr:MAG: hypothetical protein D6738_04705 [Acidobacteriota bacterium]